MGSGRELIGLNCSNLAWDCACGAMIGHLTSCVRFLCALLQAIVKSGTLVRRVISEGCEHLALDAA